MSLGPQWCLGVLFGCFCLGKRLALGRGHLERTWWTWVPRRGPGTTGGGREVETRRILPVEEIRLDC